MTTMKFGNKTRSLRTKQTECKLHSFVHAFYYDALLITTACVLGLRGAFLSGSVSSYGIDVIVVVAFISY